MDQQRIFLDIGMILVAGLLGGTLFSKLKLPAAVGIILAGVALSPFTPGYTVNANEEIVFIGQIGALLIMFTIGLEFDHRFLEKIGRKAFLLAAVACTATFLAGLMLGTALGLPRLETILIGMFFISTSTPIGLRMIDEMGLSRYKNAKVLQAALVIDDLFGFLALTVYTSEIGTQNPSVLGISLMALSVLAAVIAIFFIGVKVIPIVLSHAEKQMKDSSLTLAVAFCLFLSYAVVSMSISPLIGAFLAGTILTASLSHRNILDALKPLMNLFGAVFFVSIGLMLDPKLIPPIIGVAVLYSVVALSTKAAAAAIALRKMGTPPGEALNLGIVTGPRGEVLLIMAQTSVLASAVGQEYLAIATAIVLITAVASPVLINLLKRHTWTTAQN
ncbi:MAG: cation:proton antiporter [Candidatus Altiarchaeia archaeon]